MRSALLLFLLSAAGAGAAPVSIPPLTCPGSASVSEFEFLLDSPKAKQTLALRSVNLVDAGDRLEYKPVRLPDAIKNKAKVVVVLAPAQESSAKRIAVLEAVPANEHAEWTVPFRSSVVGLVFGPHGLDVKKVNSLVKKDPELVSQLADYAEQTSTVEALVETLAQYEQSSPGSSNLQAVLGGFSAQYGVALPPVNSSASSTEEASTLLRSLMPAFTPANDPLGGANVAKGSAGLAASVASMFFGSPVGLAMGGAALFQNLRVSIFPNTDFRAAFAQPAATNAMNLCAKSEATKAGTRLAYLWMLRVPDADAPKAIVVAPSSLPLGATSTVKVSTATVAQLKLLPRARDWELMSAKKEEIPVPVKVTVAAASDTLTLDLTGAKLAAGEYRLAAKWDWTQFFLGGAFQLHPIADFSAVKINPESLDRLVAGSGTVPLKLSGADFEFVNRAALVNRVKPSATVPRLSFSLPTAEKTGERPSLEVDVDTASLAPGPYFVELQQVNGATHDVPVIVHPPNPKIENLPLRVNLGEHGQKIRLHGSGLERIEQITSPGAVWHLAALPVGTTDGTQRDATIELGPQARAGEQLAASVSVDGIHKALEISNVLEVVGPRPKVVSVRKSFVADSGIAFRDGEIPADSAVSFVIQSENAAAPTLDLACDSDNDAGKKLTLAPGVRNGTAEFDVAGDGSFFLSLVPGNVGQSGCQLAVTIANPTTGASNPYPLGRITLLPHIDKFSINDEKLGPSLYSGILQGKDLQLIAKTGWDEKVGYPVQGIPTPVSADPREQTLKIEMPWPPPSPGAPLYIWLLGEDQGRSTTAKY